mgnify:CR=1 FL=1|tara:strand:+ start:12354 stop:12557 length:204 start_codon:yes stop_codon:yes gene_type:complete
MISEQEYIHTKDLGILASAIKVLQELIPENSEVIDKKDYDEIMRLLIIWEMEHFDKIKIHQRDGTIK